MKEECWNLLEKFSASYELDAAIEECVVREIMLDSLDAQIERFPSGIADALRVARLYHSGNAVAPELVTVRVQMWNIIDGKSCDFGDSFVCSIRAVICVLFPWEEDSYPAESKDNYLEFYQGAQLDDGLFMDAVKNVYARYAVK